MSFSLLKCLISFAYLCFSVVGIRGGSRNCLYFQGVCYLFCGCKWSLCANDWQYSLQCRFLFIPCPCFWQSTWTSQSKEKLDFFPPPLFSSSLPHLANSVSDTTILQEMYLVNKLWFSPLNEIFSVVRVSWKCVCLVLNHISQKLIPFASRKIITLILFSLNKILSCRSSVLGASQWQFLWVYALLEPIRSTWPCIRKAAIDDL